MSSGEQESGFARAYAQSARHRLGQSLTEEHASLDRAMAEAVVSMALSLSVIEQHLAALRHNGIATWKGGDW